MMNEYKIVSVLCEHFRDSMNFDGQAEVSFLMPCCRQVFLKGRKYRRLIGLRARVASSPIVKAVEIAK
jgi:hypothetical protein